MTVPSEQQVCDALESTWPPSEARRSGPWTLRNGAGGGQRVSATTAEAGFDPSDLDQAEAAMTGMGQPHLFMIREDESELDAALEARGYQIKDPVVLYACRVAALTQEPLPRVAAFAIWPPLAIAVDLWAKGGIGPTRIDVMKRCNGAKTGILARHADQPAGAAFVAIEDRIAMIHAIEVAPHLRRQGVGRNILRAAGFWAQDQGAEFMTLAVTRANEGANALYASLGMTVVGHYHYRIK